MAAATKLKRGFLKNVGTGKQIAFQSEISPLETDITAILTTDVTKAIEWTIIPVGVTQVIVPPKPLVVPVPVTTAPVILPAIADTTATTTAAISTATTTETKAAPTSTVAAIPAVPVSSTPQVIPSQEAIQALTIQTTAIINATTQVSAAPIATTPGWRIPPTTGTPVQLVEAKPAATTITPVATTETTTVFKLTHQDEDGVTWILDHSDSDNVFLTNESTTSRGQRWIFEDVHTVGEGDLPALKRVKESEGTLYLSGEKVDSAKLILKSGQIPTPPVPEKLDIEVDVQMKLMQWEYTEKK